jgi:hypothetical protein
VNLTKICTVALLMGLSWWGTGFNRAFKVTQPMGAAETIKIPESNGARPTLLQSDFVNSDCSGPTPAGYTRIFIASRSDGKLGSGSSTDAFDGSTADRFDTVLRSRSESGVTHLIVCIGPGTFYTDGTHDYVLEKGQHLDASHPGGFTVNAGWRIHGAGADRTTLRLASLVEDPSTGRYLVGIIIGTHDFDSTGIEVSDLTADDNYPALKPRYHSDLQLGAVVLRSNRGHQWIHHIHVMNVSGEQYEGFPVAITSPTPNPENQGNLIEYVTMDHWAGGRCTAITIAGGEGEVRYNTVAGYQIGYGGWNMTNVKFHDNQAIETTYGFNVDSWQNTGIVIARNQVIRPQSYGLVIGGNGDFSNFSITDNVLTLASAGHAVYGMLFQGHVRGARVIGNKIVADGARNHSNVLGFFEKNTQNTGNVFQENTLDGSFKSSLQGADCVYGNVSESGKELPGLRNTQSTRCLAEP